MAPLLLIGVFAWQSFSMYKTERARYNDSIRTQFVEQSRLALWRIDSMFMSILARESTSLPENFLESAPLEFEEARFEVMHNGDLRTAQGTNLDSVHVPEELVQIARNGLGKNNFVFGSERHDVALNQSTMQVMLGTEDFRLRQNIVSEVFASAQDRDAPISMRYESRKLKTPINIQPAILQPSAKPVQESADNTDTERLMGGFVQSQSKFTDAEGIDKPVSEVLSGSGKPKENSYSPRTEFVSNSDAVWAGNDLYIVRTIIGINGEVIRTQCLRLDHERLFRYLLSPLRDAMPNAEIVRNDSDERDYLSLASMPCHLIPGELNKSSVELSLNSLRLSLIISWLCLILAMFGIAAFVIGIMRLGAKHQIFVSAVTHELRTPLTSINMYAEMLSAGLVPKERQSVYFRTLECEAKRLIYLVNNILAFTKVTRNGEKPFKRERVTVLDLCQAFLPRIEKRIMETEMDVVLKIDPDSEELPVLTDVTAVEQVLFNLADNAAKYANMPDGKVRVEVKMNGRFLEIYFIDCGNGIPENFKQHIFEPFSRAAEDAAGKQPGVGLGLPLCRRIARTLGGDLILLKSDSAGTTFLMKIARN